MNKEISVTPKHDDDNGKLLVRNGNELSGQRIININVKINK